MNKKEKIEYGRYVIEEITSKFLKKDSPYFFLSGYEYLREVITLYGKQSNLLESTLLLLENNHAEEAYLLLRSILNNKMLIEYLCNDDEDRSRYKEYMIQPEKSRISFLKDIKRAVDEGWMDKKGLENLDEKIEEYEQALIDKGFKKTQRKRNKTITYADTRTLSIRKMALTDELSFGTYMTFYRDGSKYEHSDFSALNIYRQPVHSDVPNTQAFVLDLSRTDTELEGKVLNTAITMYSLTFTFIFRHMLNNHKHLFQQEELPALVALAQHFADNDKYFMNSSTPEKMSISEGAQQ
ncbi:DUF5677 domain-containing protein [Priestia megaterium]|uniref:DUF5677 domain-containing protein n=1 Tax=Priestia megaterium TaxID=1404 RepID=UPI00132A631F|nr:DUF5677 domain-containing protein [Priestia megaterium]MUL29486.1 hypothetical protein [Priestia megaterium]